MERLWAELRRGTLVPERTVVVDTASAALRRCVHRLSHAPSLYAPQWVSRFEVHGGSCGIGCEGASRKFSPEFRQALRAEAGYRCSIPTCRSRAFLTVHHVLFRSDGGKPMWKNASCLCRSCHEGGHGLLSLLPMRSSSRKGFREHAILVSGLEPEIAYAVTRRFEEERRITVTPMTLPHGEMEPNCDPEFWNEEVVYDNRIEGDPEDVHLLRTCQATLGYIVRTAHRPGRIHPEAQQILLDFVDEHFLSC